MFARTNDTNEGVGIDIAHIGGVPEAVYVNTCRYRVPISTDLR